MMNPQPPTHPRPPSYLRPPTIAGLVLLTVGTCSLVWMFSDLIHFPGWFFGWIWRFWPVIFWIPAAAFLLPLLQTNQARNPVYAMRAVPGMALAGLGALFLYTSLTSSWGSWAYLWTLIPLGPGIGMIIAGQLRRLDGLIHGGTIACMTSVIGFTLFSAFLGHGLVRAIGPLALIAVGLVLLGRNLQSRR